MKAAGIEPAQKKGLRHRNSPMCTLSQNGYGARRSELNCAEEIVLAALEAPADDTMIRASTIGHQEIQQAVAFSTGHAVLKAGPDWAATVAAAKSGAPLRLCGCSLARCAVVARRPVVLLLPAALS